MPCQWTNSGFGIVNQFHLYGNALAHADRLGGIEAIVPDCSDGMVLGNIYQDRTNGYGQVGRSGQGGRNRRGKGTARAQRRAA